MVFIRYLAVCGDPGAGKYGWQMCMRSWPKNDRDCLLEVDFDGEGILDRMVIESHSSGSRQLFAKWWLKHRRRPEKADERDIDAWVESLFSLSPELDLKS